MTTLTLAWFMLLEKRVYFWEVQVCIMHHTFSRFRQSCFTFVSFTFTMALPMKSMKSVMETIDENKQGKAGKATKKIEQLLQ